MIGTSGEENVPVETCNSGVASIGTVFGVGIGPGDPELLTLKAARIIRSVPVLFVPKGKDGGDSYALSIVKALIDQKCQKVKELVFPMTRNEILLKQSWEKALEEIVTEISAGKDAAFLTEGDPLTFSTFIPIYRLLVERYPCISVDIVPGIGSAFAAAATSGISLVDGDERFAIIPAVFVLDQLPELLSRFECIVLLKVNRVFDRLVEILLPRALLDDRLHERLVHGCLLLEICGTTASYASAASAPLADAVGGEPLRKNRVMARAAARACWMARITVAEPLTMSPPANTSGIEVRMSASTWM
jgi:precorrin-2/cobalt-factor-2 C20-methyltransferase